MSKKMSKKTSGAKGGTARANSLSQSERSAIAKKAAEARWANPKAEFEGTMLLGDIEIPCYVLADGRRLISHRGLQGSMTMAVSGGAKKTAEFFDRIESRLSRTRDLAARLNSPIVFIPKVSGRTAFGYEADILADICEVMLDARKEIQLTGMQLRVADQCEILLRGFGKVGIAALVDEATGYQEVRDRHALQEILDKYLRSEFAAWAKKFPDDFYREIFRLRGWTWKGMKVNRPQVVAKYTNDLVYERLAPGILDELQRKNPISDGKRKSKHHQWLTEDIGDPRLSEHLYGLIGLMRTCDTWDQLKDRIKRAYPKRSNDTQLTLFNEEDI